MIFWIVVSILVLVVLILAGLLGIVAIACLLPDDWSGLEDPNESGSRPL